MEWRVVTELSKLKAKLAVAKGKSEDNTKV